jgi:formate transporter
MVAIEQGMGKIVGGMVFSAGLVLVLIAGAELFTGNILMILGAMVRLYSPLRIFRNWSAVYLGNFLGSFIFAVLVYQAGLMGHAGDLNDLGKLSVGIAHAKLGLTFSECFIRGIFCNMLVILAIIMALSAKDVISKIFCCILPITIFVACGFEHCVANMFLIPVGLLSEGRSIVGSMAIFHNVIPVTLGNIVGGLLIILMHPQRVKQLIRMIHISNKNTQ